MYDYRLYEMFLTFLFWSITGWLIEVVDMRIEAGEFQDRGFLHLPICPLYGVGMTVMTILFRNETHYYAELFFFGMVVGSFVEYFVGWLLEKLFNTKWWDYSHMRFQLKGRVCLRNTMLFGFGAIITIGFVQPIVDQGIHRIPLPLGMEVAQFIALIIAIDTVASVHRALQYRKSDETGEVLVIFKSHR